VLRSAAGNFIAIGLNYVQHAVEDRRRSPTIPSSSRKLIGASPDLTIQYLLQKAL
jgi:hypothetical protein